MHIDAKSSVFFIQENYTAACVDTDLLYTSLKKKKVHEVK